MHHSFLIRSRSVDEIFSIIQIWSSTLLGHDNRSKRARQVCIHRSCTLYHSYTNYVLNIRATRQPSCFASYFSSCIYVVSIRSLLSQHSRCCCPTISFGFPDVWSPLIITTTNMYLLVCLKRIVICNYLHIKIVAILLAAPSPPFPSPPRSASPPHRQSIDCLACHPSLLRIHIFLVSFRT